jgi:hypothetical protein
LLFKKSIAKCKEEETELNLAESSEEGYGSKRAVLSMMMMMMISKVFLVTSRRCP